MDSVPPTAGTATVFYLYKLVAMLNLAYVEAASKYQSSTFSSSIPEQYLVAIIAILEG
jgi:hypothetical protein